MSNPLLIMDLGLPRFAQIATHHVVPAIDELIANNQNAIEQLLQNPELHSWQGLLYPIEQINERLSRAWSQISLIESVNNTPEFHEAYDLALGKLSDYQTELAQNETYYQALVKIKNSDEFHKMGEQQRRIVELGLRNFELSGIHLAPADKSRYKELVKRLTELESQFSQNILECTKAWNLEITNLDDLRGLPQHTLDSLKQRARQKGLDTWLLDLSAPTYLAVMTSSENRTLRAQFYQAYATRASLEGPHPARWDNGLILEEIVKLRLALAHLLGFANYGEYSLASKMADNPGQVLDFLNDLGTRSQSMAHEELAELQAFADSEGLNEPLKVWDLAFYSEKLCHTKFQLSQEALRPYFPLKRVLQGLFQTLHKLFGLEFKKIEQFDTWHQDVLLFEVSDARGAHRGHFYLDLFARESKRGGAWMADGRSRFLTDEGLQHPFAFVVTNFTPPQAGQDALLTHDDLLTLFHEMGHCLHHILTQIDYPSIAGINGVEWDAVELPSQLLENWAWEDEVLKLVSQHIETQESLPQALAQNLKASKNFQAGMQMLRQIEFSLFDFKCHLLPDAPTQQAIQDLLAEIRRTTALLSVPAYNRFQNSFSHIFAGGYAAGYYSYKWAEVLASDVYSAFEEKGLFDTATASSYLECIVERGGSQDAMDLFVKFRGRPPQIDALLRHSGIA